MPAEILKSSLLTSAGFAHGFATRRGGASSAPFDTLSFHAAAASAEDVRENVRRVADEVGFAPGALYLLRQVHGAVVYTAADDPPPVERPQADAVVLDVGRTGGVRIADCVPILVGDLVTGRAAAVHAGWRGVEAGVVGAALSALGDSRSMRVAAMGPSIGPCCFEVGADVAERIALAAGDPAVVTRREGGKAWVDLRLAVRAQLRAYGLTDGDIESVGGCTRCDRASFFSFRRDGAASGRHLAVIRAKSGPLLG